QATFALLEAGAKFNTYEVDLSNKPDWFVKQVSPLGKAPALTYGGPDVPFDKPSPESAKLADSRVILEFIAERFPGARLLPEDPILRAQTRFFIEVVRSRFMQAWRGHFLEGKPSEPFFAALEEVQALLPPHGFAVGELSIADITIAPILARAEVIFELNHPLSGWTEGESVKYLDMFKGPRFARLKQYRQDLEERAAFRASFDKVRILLPPQCFRRRRHIGRFQGWVERPSRLLVSAYEVGFVRVSSSKTDTSLYT
ncbi:hypothetical protein CERSUDRAFT_50767, partial [Gelatoporia subvermispora B]